MNKESKIKKSKGPKRFNVREHRDRATLGNIVNTLKLPSRTGVHNTLNHINEKIITAMSESLELGLSQEQVASFARSAAFDRQLIGLLDKLETLKVHEDEVKDERNDEGTK